jgi:hypothetical protein
MEREVISQWIKVVFCVDHNARICMSLLLLLFLYKEYAKGDEIKTMLKYNPLVPTSPKSE